MNMNIQHFKISLGKRKHNENFIKQKKNKKIKTIAYNIWSYLSQCDKTKFLLIQSCNGDWMQCNAMQKL